MAQHVWSPRRPGVTSRPPSSPTGPTRPRSTARSSRSRRYPPLVFAGEARDLHGRARAGRRRATPSCSRPATAPSRSTTFSAVNIREKLKVILQMAVVLTYSLGRAGREGRAASPASSPSPARSPTERIGDVELPALPRPHRQRRRAHRRGPHARPRAARAGLPPVGVDAEPAAGVHQGRLRRPVPGPRVEPGVRGHQPRGPALRAARRRDRPGAALHAGLRDRPRAEPPAPRGRLLHQPRGAASSATRRRSPARTR